MAKLVDLSGKYFGRLYVRCIDGKNNYGQIVYTCECSCGKTIKVPGLRLKDGRTKSCGCLRKERNRLDFAEASFNKLYLSYKRGAFRRNLDFSLTSAEFRMLTSKPCFYCGDLPKTVTHRKNFYGDYIYNGIDRIDNKL